METKCQIRLFVHWQSLAYFFTSLHYLKHKGISIPPFLLLPSPLSLYFFPSSPLLSSILLIPYLHTLHHFHVLLLLFLPHLCWHPHILSSPSLCSSHLVSPHLFPQLSASCLTCCPPPFPSSPPFLLLLLSCPHPSSLHVGSPSDDCRAHFIWHKDKGLSTHVVSLV